MKNIYVVFLVSTLFFSSCKDSKHQVGEGEFPEINKIESKEFPIKEIMADPKEILILDNIYVIKDNKSDFILHVFSLEHHKHMGSFVRRGKGPAEELLIQSVSRTIEGALVYKTLSDIVLAEFSPLVNQFNTIERFEVPVDLLTVAYPFKKTKILGWNYNLHENEFLIYNSLDKQFSDFGNGFPGHKRNLTLEEKHRLYGNKQMTIKPDRRKLATAYMSFPMLRIFDSENGKLINEVISCHLADFPHALINRNATQDQIREVVEYYFKITSTDHFIYALFSGKTKDELYPELLTPNFSVPDFGNEIHVWDWDGNPVKKIILDRMIFSFDVCLNDSNLIAISVNEPEKIFVFDLD